MKQAMVFTLIALMVFKDKITKKIIQSGQLLQTDDLTRVNDLVRRGLCEIQAVNYPSQEDPGVIGEGNLEFQGINYSVADVKVALTEIGAGVNANAGIKGVGKKISELSEDQLSQLMDKLNNITD